MRAYAYLNVERPWIAWLVSRGILVSASRAHKQALSVWQAGYIRDLAGLRARERHYLVETRLEEVRSATFQTAVSRLSGLYMFPSLELARESGTRWDAHFDEQFLTELEILGEPEFSKHDSDFISEDMHSSDEAWMSPYWRGEQRSAKPAWELLVEGRATVLRKDLRDQALSVVESTWPESMSLHHVARAASELGSDLGLIVPMLISEERGVRLRFVMNLEDAQDEEFLSQLEVYKGKTNLGLLAGADRFQTPDLRSLEVVFATGA